MITWNNRVRLILADVDETVADLYLPATPEMIKELENILKEGKVIFFVTGHGLTGVQQRITDRISNKLRKRILIAHCSGAEVWGFENNGSLRNKPYYSLYEDRLSDSQKSKWRAIIGQLITEFDLKTFPATPIPEFKEKAGDDPLAMMLEDRGPQITFEMVNGYDISPQRVRSVKMNIPQNNGHYDMRIPILERSAKLFSETNMPITPRIAGTFALDFAVVGVSKTTSVRHVLADQNILASVDLTAADVGQPENLEIWGDKFSVIRGGSDRHMCEAVNPKVRAIDFREENPEEFLPGYNIAVWNGKKHLQDGLLEYLQSR